MKQSWKILWILGALLGWMVGIGMAADPTATSHDHHATSTTQQPITAGTIVATGTLVAIMGTEHKLKIHHDPIPELKWPAMVMDFPVAPQIALDAFKKHAKIRFTLLPIGPTSYQITAVATMPP